MPSPVNEPLTPLVVTFGATGTGVVVVAEFEFVEVEFELEEVVEELEEVVCFLLCVVAFFVAAALGVATAAALCSTCGAADVDGVGVAAGTEEAAEAPAKVESPLSLN